MEFEVRGRNLTLSDPLEELVERRFDFALGRFAGEIRRVDVKLNDLQGPRRGAEKQCRVEVTLRHGGSVRAEGSEEQLRDAIDMAAHRVRRQLGRRLDRDARPRRGLPLTG